MQRNRCSQPIIATEDRLKILAMSEFESIQPPGNILLYPKVGDLNIYLCPFCGLEKPSFNWLFSYDGLIPHNGFKYCDDPICVKNVKLSLTNYLIYGMKLPYRSTFDENFNSDTHGKCSLVNIFWYIPKENDRNDVRCANDYIDLETGTTYRGQTMLQFTSSGDNKQFCRTIENFEKYNPGEYTNLLSKINYPEYYPNCLRQAFINDAEARLGV